MSRTKTRVVRAISSSERLRLSAVKRWVPWSTPRGTAVNQKTAIAAPSQNSGSGERRLRNAAAGSERIAANTKKARAGSASTCRVRRIT